MNGELKPSNQPAGRVVMVAGEASGDALGADLIQALKSKVSPLEIAGIGGPRMQAAGMDIWHDSDELAVMGLAEVVRHLPRLLRLRRHVARRTLEYRPHVFVGIDAPDFNLGLARSLKGRGIRTVQYVSPSIWAWRPGRAARIGECVDRVLALFPFEPEIYGRYNVDARFVGHPMADRLPLEPDAEAARSKLDLPATRPVIALLPGSRRTEVGRLGDVMAEAAGLIAEALPGAVFASPAASPATREMFDAAMRRLAPNAQVRIFDQRAEEVLTAADVGIIASGTATLEGLLTRTPMVAVYRVSGLTYLVARKLGLLKIDRYSLPNVLAGEALVPELMQYELRPRPLADEVLALLKDDERKSAMMARFRSIHDTLRCDAAERAATEVLAVMGLRS